MFRDWRLCQGVDHENRRQDAGVPCRWNAAISGFRSPVYSTGVRTPDLAALSGVDHENRRQDAGIPTMTSAIHSRGRLPHWEEKGGIYFVTFRLYDSLPQDVVRQIHAERREFLCAHRENREPSLAERKRIAKLFARRTEMYLDRGVGSCFLARPGVAAKIAEAIRYFAGHRYRLFAWCVMPNHVHVLFQPFPEHSLAEIVHSWKSFTATEANRILGRSGRFWQREYFDRLVRREGEFTRVIRYVAENPARAGLRDWPWVGMYL